MYFRSVIYPLKNFHSNLLEIKTLRTLLGPIFGVLMGIEVSLRHNWGPSRKSILGCLCGSILVVFWSHSFDSIGEDSLVGVHLRALLGPIFEIL